MDGELLTEGKCEMRVMGSTSTLKKYLEQFNVEVLGGHTKIMWDPNNVTEVENARRAYEYLTGKQFAAYKINKQGDPGERVNAFDPRIGAYIMSPAMAGG